MMELLDAVAPLVIIVAIGYEVWFRRLRAERRAQEKEWMRENGFDPDSL